jgi:3-hydroxybutyryl-CoA dehydratase
LSVEFEALCFKSSTIVQFVCVGYMNQLYFEDMTIGRSESLERNVTVELVEAFAEVSGDNNPLHLDAAYAATTRFKERIAHGALTNSFISAVLGTKLPGVGAVYVSQSVRFKAPVKLGTIVTAKATVTARDAEKNFVTLETACLVGDQEVAVGEAVLFVPGRG